MKKRGKEALRMAFYLEIGQIFGYVIKGWIKSRNRGEGREVEGEVSEERKGTKRDFKLFFLFFLNQKTFR